MCLLSAWLGRLDNDNIQARVTRVDQSVRAYKGGRADHAQIGGANDCSGSGSVDRERFRVNHCAEMVGTVALHLHLGAMVNRAQFEHIWRQSSRMTACLQLRPHLTYEERLRRTLLESGVPLKFGTESEISISDEQPQAWHRMYLTC